MNSRQVTILVPNYKTKTLTQLCLRLLRQYTKSELAKVVVIDNYSEDDSTEYLRTLPWIELIERPRCQEDGPTAHARALDAGMELVDTPFVLSIHTDTLVKRADWLEFLLRKINQSPNIAGVGSWKLESKSFIRRMAKNFEFHCQKQYYRLIGKTNHRLQGVGNNHYYFRSHCALYRTALLQKHGLSFCNDEPVCKRIHRELTERGYELPFIRSEELSVYMDHLNHATSVLNPHLESRAATNSKARRQIEQRLKQVNYQHILEQTSLDQ